MNRKFIHVAIVLAAAAVIGVTAARRGDRSIDGPAREDVVYTNDHAGHASEFEPGTVTAGPPSHPPQDDPWISRFDLTERSGEQMSDQQLLGKPYVVSFFFSSCPSICVTQNQKIQELQDEFRGQPVRFVAISVDPENDTPERLREYAARFGADKDQWLFLTGDLDEIRRVGEGSFRQPVDRQFHSERFILVDALGKVEGIYTWPEERHLSELKERIRELVDSVDS